MIALFIALFIGGLVIVDTALESDQDFVTARTQPISQEVIKGKNGGSMNPSLTMEDFHNMPESERTMKNYYANRAYPGAPPMITHPLLSEKGIGGKTCLQCHGNGGYVPQFDAYAPVTPHPEWISCKQCHLPAKEAASFVKSNWEKPSPPVLGSKALFTSPLIMPHGLKNRENCLSCHVGPGAPKEIRVTHPERINCRQCHVPKESNDLFLVQSTANNGTLLFHSSNNHSKSIESSEEQSIKKWIRDND